MHFKFAFEKYIKECIHINKKKKKNAKKFEYLFKVVL